MFLTFFCPPVMSLPSLHLSMQDMLDSAKRLQLLVRSDGRILTFKADPAVLAQVFGQDAATLNKKVRGGCSCWVELFGRLGHCVSIIM